MTSFVYQYYGYDAYAPFRLAASVLWCWSWEKEGRAAEVVPGI